MLLVREFSAEASVHLHDESVSMQGAAAAHRDGVWTLTPRLVSSV